ncbi:hypothetical protein HF086_005335 [Spodoptera exigua]|uniref:Uncharacterized protein n=1 Tax=Spodoptera exigua TaxID=7107 RepID=A0A922MZM7_SPOEX|nr:hypothetical protein HF086_005335 [Spodoptera exigua]
MGKGQSKSKETVVVQNTVGGSNIATLEEFRYHLTTTNILLLIIVLGVLLAVLCVAYRMYKRCHLDWITREINSNMLRRSLVRRQAVTPKGDCEAM